MSEGEIMRQAMRVLGVLLVVTGATSACRTDTTPAELGDSVRSTATAPRPVPTRKRDVRLTNKKWLLESLNGMSVGYSRGSDYLLYFDGEQVHGNDGCNEFWIGYTAGGGDLVFSNEGMSTAIGCEMDVYFDGYPDALRKAASYRIMGSRLSIRNAVGNEILTFRRVPPSDLDGTLWELQSVNGDPALPPPPDPADSDKFTLSFDEVRLVWWNGCNVLILPYTARNSRLGIGDDMIVREGCQKSEMNKPRLDPKLLLEATTYHRIGNRLEIGHEQGKPVLVFTVYQYSSTK